MGNVIFCCTICILQSTKLSWILPHRFIAFLLLCDVQCSTRLQRDHAGMWLIWMLGGLGMSLVLVSNTCIPYFVSILHIPGADISYWRIGKELCVMLPFTIINGIGYGLSTTVEQASISWFAPSNTISIWLGGWVTAFCIGVYLTIFLPLYARPAPKWL